MLLTWNLAFDELRELFLQSFLSGHENATASDRN